MCGCYVFVPPKLYRRLPEVIQPFCKKAPVGNPDRFMELLRETTLPLPDDDPNATLKAEAFETYASVLL